MTSDGDMLCIKIIELDGSITLQLKFLLFEIIGAKISVTVSRIYMFLKIFSRKYKL